MVSLSLEYKKIKGNKMDKEMENRITEIVNQVIKRKRVAWKRLLNKKRLHWQCCA
jgi:hypothetical protein